MVEKVDSTLQRGSEESARSAIWRRGVPTNEKKDRLLRGEEVITHASRPKGPADFQISEPIEGFGMFQLSRTKRLKKCNPVS